MCHSPSPGGSRSRVRCVPWFIHKQTQAFCLTTGDRSKRMGVEEDSDNQPGQASLSQAWGSRARPGAPGGPQRRKKTGHCGSGQTCGRRSEGLSRTGRAGESEGRRAREAPAAWGCGNARGSRASSGDRGRVGRKAVSPPPPPRAVAAFRLLSLLPTWPLRPRLRAAAREGPRRRMSPPCSKPHSGSHVGAKLKPSQCLAMTSVVPHDLPPLPLTSPANASPPHADSLLPNQPPCPPTHAPGPCLWAEGLCSDSLSGCAVSPTKICLVNSIAHTSCSTLLRSRTVNEARPARPISYCK